MKKILITISILLTSLQAHALEDCIITTNGKLTDIRIENNTIIDVFPIITVMNKKNTIVVHPLKTGTTCFTIKKNNKEDFIFHIYVEENKTIISKVEGFNILTIDSPPEKEELYLDMPPNSIKKEG